MKGYLLLFLLQNTVFAAQFSGFVVDAKGQPVTNTIVRLQGTPFATLTDQKGHFNIFVDEAINPKYITAWKSGFYNGGQPVSRGNKKYRIVLNSIPVNDNQEYKWIPPLSNKILLLIKMTFGTKPCQICHPELAEQWRKSTHAGSAINPLFLNFFNGTDATGEKGIGPGYKLDFPNSNGNCATCHVPALALNNPFNSDPNEAQGIAREGVFCDLCHKIKDTNIDQRGGYPGILSIQFQRPAENHQLFYGPYDDVFPGDDSYHPIYKNGQYCAPCHNGKFWDVLAYSEFQEWAKSSYAKRNIHCQDCHMKSDGKLTRFALEKEGGVIRDPKTIPSHENLGVRDRAFMMEAISLKTQANLKGDRLEVSVTIKNVNAGQTWYQSNSGITVKGGLTGDAINIFSLTIDPNNPDIVWAGTFGENEAFGVFKSTDGGASWTLKTKGISLDSEAGLVFRGFSIQQGNSNVVYAQAEVPTSVQGWEFNRVKGRVYKTTDGGESWRLIWQGDNLPRYLIVDPGNPNVLYLSTGIFDREAYSSDCAKGIAGGVGLLKSTDGGETWVAINNGLTDRYIGSLRMHPANPLILFAASGNNACSGIYTGNIVSGLFGTTDGGTSWTKVIAGDIITTVNFSPSNPTIVYAGSGSAFYRSEDGGSTWSKFSKSSGDEWGPAGIRAGVPIDVIVDPANPYLLYANNYGGGVFRSTDGAKTWEDWSKGYSGAEIHAIEIPTKSSSAVYAIGRSGPFVSKNYGGNWAGIANGDASFAEWYSIAVQPMNPNLILISDEHQGVILRSTDGGSYFTNLLRHPEANAADPNKRQGFKTVVFSPSDPKVVYAGLAKDRNTFRSSSPPGTVIYKSTDAGATFAPMRSIIDGHTVNELVVYPNDSSIVYAATSNGIYKTTDGAASWTHFDSLGNRHIEALVINPQQPNHMGVAILCHKAYVAETFRSPKVEG